MDDFPALPVEAPADSDPRSPTPQAQEHVDDAVPTASEPEPKLLQYQIGKNGDLKLRVGTNLELEDENIEAVEYLVHSRAVEITAPAFYRRLNELWRESRRPLRRSRKWIVDLPDDNPAAMCIVLDIMHGRTYFVPRSFDSTEDLFDVCVLAQKYDLVHLLGPWVGIWNAPRRLYDDTIDGIWINWVLGDAVRFASMCGTALKSSVVEEDASDEGKRVLVLDPDSHSDARCVDSTGIAGEPQPKIYRPTKEQALTQVSSRLYRQETT